MNRGLTTQDQKGKIIGITASALMHAALLFIVMSYHTNRPPEEPLTVFVSQVTTNGPIITKTQQEHTMDSPVPAAKTTNDVTPPATQQPASHSQLATPAAPASAVIPTIKTVPTSVTTSAPASAPTPSQALTPMNLRAQTATPSGPVPPPARESDAQTSPLMQQGELSVICSDRTSPSYPRQSMRLGEQGKTVLRVDLDELGHVTAVAVKSSSGFARLDEAAITAVKTWRCSPAQHNGLKIRSVALQPFVFTLKGR